MYKRVNCISSENQFYMFLTVSKQNFVQDLKLEVCAFTIHGYFTVADDSLRQREKSSIFWIIWWRIETIVTLRKKKMTTEWIDYQGKQQRHLFCILSENSWLALLITKDQKYKLCYSEVGETFYVSHTSVLPVIKINSKINVAKE